MPPSSAPLVCLLAAGRGTRMGSSLSHLNKALLPLGSQAILSHIIDKFPIDSQFVIALGHLGHQIKAYLQCAYPERHFNYVNVPNWKGPGSGPGTSILACRDQLERPFYFIACDTLWTEQIDFSWRGNWIGIGKIRGPDSEKYCTVHTNQEGLVSQFIDKQKTSLETPNAFIGLAHIAEPELFFSSLQTKQTALAPDQELQISHGLEALTQVKAHFFTWEDLGSQSLYLAACTKREDFDFSKPEEAIFFPGAKRAVKYFSHSEFVSKRIARAKLKPNIFPSIDQTQDQFYSYALIKGQTLYENMDRLPQLYPWLKEYLWPSVEPTPANFKQLCNTFYKEKTLARVESWYAQVAPHSEPTQINGKPIASLRSLLELVDWNYLAQGEPAFFHGDLQPDNILCTSQGFTLLDWRQDFAGSLATGDLYYDLAKLNGGLLLNYRLAKQGKFEYREQGKDAYFILPEYPLQRVSLDSYDAFIVTQKFDRNKIELLTGLIFANMAPLHSPPFNRLVAALARQKLHGMIHGT